MIRDTDFPEVNKLLLFLVFILLSTVLMADVYTYRTNSHTGRPDLVTIIAPNITPSSTYTGFTFDGTNYCLYVNGVQKECWTQSATTAINYALLEDSTYILLEDNSRMLLEQ